MGVYANGVGDEERFSALKKALVALALLGVMAVVASPAQAQESTINTITVNSLDDVTNPEDGDCTLSEAITSANTDKSSGDATNECAAGSGSDVIHVGVTGTVNLTGALPDLSGNVRIEGPGADQLTVRRDSAAGAFRIFTVGQGSEVFISGITISGGNAPGGSGGGIANEGTLTISGSTISGNSAVIGGGIHNREGILTVSDSTISGNSAGFGGGVFSDTNLSSAQKTTITNSTISGNSATNQGGGVHNFAGLSVIEHSTITKNTAPGGQGSGVASFGVIDTRTEVLSSIISANQGTDVDFVDEDFNSFDSKGYNLIGDGNATAAFNETGDQSGVGDPKLGALADNGGPTLTHALLAISPARDTIPQGTNGCGTTFTEDQRGVGRPQGSACDIGAFELTTITLNSTEDTTANDGKCTLREAITSANTDTASGAAAGECAAGSVSSSDVIDIGVTGMVNLTGALPNLSSNLQIKGPGADQLTVRRTTGSDYRIFTVAGGSEVSISGITISGGSATGDLPNSAGGGIANEGTLTISGSTVSSNSAEQTSGGGIYNRQSTLTISGSTINSNSAIRRRRRLFRHQLLQPKDRHHQLHHLRQHRYEWWRRLQRRRPQRHRALHRNR